MSSYEFGLQRGGVHPVLELINKCDALAKTFDATFAQSVTLIEQVANNSQGGAVAYNTRGAASMMEQMLVMLRDTLQKCEATVNQMLGCIYSDVPLLLDQLDADQQATASLPSNFNPKSALDSISQLFYVGATTYALNHSQLTLPASPQSYQELLLEKRELLSDFTCEDISPGEFFHRWGSIDDGGLHNERKKDVDDLADLLSAF